MHHKRSRREEGPKRGSFSGNWALSRDDDVQRGGAKKVTSLLLPRSYPREFLLFRTTKVILHGIPETEKKADFHFAVSLERGKS